MAEVTAKIELLLEEVVKKNASDLHLQAGLPPMFRIDGTLVPALGASSLDGAEVEALVHSFLDEDQKAVLAHSKEVDFSFAFGHYGRFRVNAFHERGNLAAALRLLPATIKTIEELGLPKKVEAFTEFARGLVIITGPTGSGKSTTLAALVDKINHERAAHIVTIEDPIEYTFTSKKSIVVQREIHYDSDSFPAALRSSFRQDPDVVMLGEMRDLETIASAITLAETGHLVLTTLHTNSAAQSVDRIIDVFPPFQQQQIRVQLAGMLQAICAQRLIPAIGGGRVVATEILTATPAVRNIIREGKTFQLDAVIQTGSEHGMQSMDRTLLGLIHAGRITYEEARNFAVDTSELDRLMRG